MLGDAPEIETSDESEELSEFDEDNDNVSEVECSEDENEQLPSMAGTKSRPRTVETFVAPEHHRNRVMQYVEFRRGVWVDAFGKIQPQDKRSGIFVSNGKKRVREAPESESEASGQETESDSSDEEVDDELNDEVDVEDLRRKQQACEQQNKRAKLQVLEDDRIVNENGEEVQKRDLLLKDLHQSAKNADAHWQKQERDKEHRLRSQKLLAATQKIVICWNKIKTTPVGRKYRMSYESNVLVTVPTFTMCFTHLKTKSKFHSSFNCESFEIQCKCTQTFGTNLTSYVEHLSSCVQT